MSKGKLGKLTHLATKSSQRSPSLQLEQQAVTSLAEAAAGILSYLWVH